MTTVIIGSGNVAWHMAKAFKEAGIDLIQLYGRNEQDLKKLSSEINVEYSTDQLKQADFYLICTSDKAIAEVSKQIPYEQALVAHTSGSLSRDVLEGPYRKACFYPLQTFSKSRKLDYSKIPLFVDAGWESDNNYEVSQMFVMKEFKEKYNKPELSEEETKEKIYTGFDVSQKLLNNKRTYADRFLKVLTPKQLEKMFEMEKRMGRRIMDKKHQEEEKK